MLKIDILIERLNTFLNEKSLPTVDENIRDFILLYKEVIKSIWSEKSILKRDLLYQDLLKFISNYIDTKNFVETFENYILELNIKYPPIISLEEIYGYCLKEYDIFVQGFLKNENVDINILYVVVKYLLMMIEKNKNSLLSYIFLNTENYSYQIYHSINSTIIALIGGKELIHDDIKIHELGIAGLLHDIGMLKIPEHILNKEEKLTTGEYDIIKNHVIIAYKFVEEKLTLSQDVIDAIMQHHEQQDGKGYPKKMRGEKINLFAKIISIADAFESQTSFRAYRRSRSGYMAMREVLSSNDNMFDPGVLKAFLMSLSIYPPGTIVQLSNNSIGVVVQINQEFPLRPKIRLIIDEYGDTLTKEVIKNLDSELNLFIVRVINKNEYQKK
ncbi:MAG TPA: HD-GYP domain-containing protein [Spirochaetota bacterium]|nr:HD-GYP domain-containing protein [Spirochaetota bacterium]